VFISHKLKEVLEVSDRITVLRAGRHMVTRYTAGATPHELAVLMTGDHSELRVRRGAARSEQPLLEIDGVSALSSRGLPALRDVTLGVYGGEIVGVAGVSGNGQTELAEVVTGLRRTESGTIRIDRTDVTDQSPRSFAEAHVGHIPEDRLGVALVRSAQVRDNAVLRQYRRPEFSTWYALRHGSIAEFARRLVAAARVQTPGIDTPTGFLSGGNQQRLVAGREAGVASRVFIASQPTRGLDVQSTGDVQRSIIDRRDAGCAVLLISDDLDEVLLMSDRVVVMYEGRIVGSFEGEEVDRRRIGLLMGGHLGEDDGRGTGE
jgi:simple sugar transport system ATP-binding protein